MKGEIRGLSAGTYRSDDNSALFRISRSDDGVKIEVADLEADVFYEFRVDDDGRTNFGWGQVSQTQKE